MPDSVSAHVKRTVTFVRFQPFAFGAGVTAAVMVGGVVSAAAARPAPNRTLTPTARQTLRRIRPFRL